MSELLEFDISHEEWREYNWVWWDGEVRRHRIFRINEPKTLYIRPGGSTHRVVDAQGIAHCVPSVGCMGCVLQWKNPDDTPPVNF